MADNHALAALLFEDVSQTPGELEALYPPRVLPEGAKVTRFAPSPTGFLHIGGVFTAMVNRRVAGPDGVFYLRIEDTDKKREVEGGVAGILDGLAQLGLHVDEGVTGEGTESGGYGPYTQSDRRAIYHVFAKALVEQGLAYPCFCTEGELAGKRAQQEAQGVNTGYYGEWAVHRDCKPEQVRQLLEEGRTYTVRLRSPGREDGKVRFKDAIKGQIEMPENIQDIVLLKADGIPTYHFAHVVDDHLMRTTHVIRGDEWISSVPVHLQLFHVLGFKAPVYAHVSPIMKEEDGGKRKLSKRKDPEAAIDWYHEQGYPAESVVEYLLTIANSNFEDWRRQNLLEDSAGFDFKLSRMSLSGALFDLNKLNDVSKNVISMMTAEEVYQKADAWCGEFDRQLAGLFERDPDYATAIFAIDRTPVKPRKDIAKWADVRGYVSYFYDEIWDGTLDMPQNIPPADAKLILQAYRQQFKQWHDKDEWFLAIKDLCEPLGFAREVKEYKKNPGEYKGHVGDASGVIRAAVTGRRNTPDLFAIMNLLGEDRVLARIEQAIKKL